MIIKLPFNNDPLQQFSIQLGSGTPIYSGNFQFTAYFNDRAGLWCFDIADANSGQVLATGVAIVLGCDLLGAFSFGIGKLVAYDETGTNKDATFDSFGTTTNVYWISDDENLLADEAG